MPAKLTTETWVEKARAKHGDRFDYSRVEYKGAAQKVEIGCPDHGWFWQNEANHRSGTGCPQCGATSRQAKRSHGYDSFVEKALEVHGGKYLYPRQEIYNSRTRAKIVCREHGPFNQMVYQHLAGKGCKHCGYALNASRSKISMDEFVERAKEVHGGSYVYHGPYAGMHDPTQIECRVHGMFSQSPHSHLKGGGCPKCCLRVSKGEADLADFVSSLGVEIVQSSRSIIAPYELDIYVPEKRLAIEYHGLWFHREELVGNKTRIKYEMCAEAGITLIQVFEDEWLNDREKVECRIKAAVGACERRYARKCALGRVDRKDARAFLEARHMQGAGTALNRVYGLWDGADLVAVASFGKGRFNNDGWELLRYCSKGRVLGGLSRLVKAFRREHVGDIVSYADLRWGDGESYGKAGFQLEKITSPDYWWADCGKRKRTARYMVQPHKIGMPEKEYAAQKGWVKVLGVGHKKWILPDERQPSPA
jgi:Zn finger protein HypA/HybF involved in hydrogenase expression